MIPPGIHVRQRAPVAPSPARGLTELAESEDADLIVVGSSRHGEPGRIRLERTAGRLFQGAPCAVAIAPGELRRRTTSATSASRMTALRRLAPRSHAGYQIAAGRGAAVTLLWAPRRSTRAREPERLQCAEEVLDAAAQAAPAA